MIPEAAVTAAAKALYADKMSNHSGDNAPQIIDACEVVARKALEAAAPHMLAAWINDTSRPPDDLPGYGPGGRINQAPIYPLGKIEDKRT